MLELLIIGEESTGDTELLTFLEREGWNVSSASSWAEARPMLVEQQPTVVIVDHRIGEEDGVEMLTEVHKASPASEVILVTPGGEIDTAIAVLRAGALDYLRRPIDTEQLRIALGRARERRQQRPTGEPAAILVLEDHEPTRRRLVRVLEKEGYRTDSAPDGQEGLRMFHEKRYNIILSDVRMPNMSGLEVLRETKGVGADVEVIVTTGYGDEDVVVQALRDGAINYLKKPIDIEQMLLAIEKALDFQTMRRSLAYRNRDVELMQELVIRLTEELELVVETPDKLNPKTTDFLKRLVDALPLAVVVIGSDRRVLFANRHVVEKAGRMPEVLSVDWLRPMGLMAVTPEDLDAAFVASLDAAPGTVEVVTVSKWSFLVMTPLRLVKPGGAERFVAVAIRGERVVKDSGSKTGT